MSSPAALETPPRGIPDEVVAVFASFPSPLRDRLLALRQLILDTAAATEGVGDIEETLKWGEPSYVPSATRSGTPVRLNRVKGTDDRYAVYVSCQTSLVGTFRQIYPDLFTYDGTRAITLHVDEPVPTDALAHCIALALRYHADRRENAAPW